MARIDNLQTRTPGVARSNPIAVGADRVNNPLSPVADFVKGVQAEREAEREQARREADVLDVEKRVNDFRIAREKEYADSLDQYDGSEAGFAEAVALQYDLASKELVEGAPERVRNELAYRFESYRDGFVLKAVEGETARSREYAARQLGDVLEGMAKGQAEAPNLDMLQSQMISVEAMAQSLPASVRAQYIETGQEMLANGFVDAMGRTDPRGLQAMVAAGQFEGDLYSYNVLERARAVAESGVARLDAAARREAERYRKEMRQQSYEQALMDLENGLDISDEQMVEMFPGEDSDALHSRRMVLQARNRERAAREQAAAARAGVDELLSGEISTHSTAGRKALNMLWDDMGGARLFQDNPRQAVQLAIQMADVYDALPSDASRSIKTYLAGGDAARQQVALDALGQIYEAAPAVAARDFSDRQVAEARRYTDTVAMGLQPELALERINQARDMTEGRAERLKEGRKKAARLDRGDLEDALEGGFLFWGKGELQGRPDNVDRLVSVYRENVAEFYADHGDYDQARRDAVVSMQRVFGKSQVTGASRIMAYPPEKHVPFAGDGKWMQAQLKKDVADWVGPEKEGQIRQIILEPDRQTAAIAKSGGNPSWMVVVEYKSGMFEALPSRYEFDYAAARRNALARDVALIGKEQLARENKLELQEVLEGRDNAPEIFAGGR